MNKANVEIGKIIKTYRLKANLSQMELSDKLGYGTPQFVSIIERGLSKAPYDKIGEMIIILGIPEKIISKYLIEEFQEKLQMQIRKGKSAARR